MVCILQAMVRGYVTMRHNAVLERCAELEAELFELRSLVSCCWTAAGRWFAWPALHGSLGIAFRACRSTDCVTLLLLSFLDNLVCLAAVDMH
jgi:hypothetical protein